MKNKSLLVISIILLLISFNIVGFFVGKTSDIPSKYIEGTDAEVLSYLISTRTFQAEFVIKTCEKNGNYLDSAVLHHQIDCLDIPLQLIKKGYLSHINVSFDRQEKVEGLLKKVDFEGTYKALVEK